MLVPSGSAELAAFASRRGGIILCGGGSSRMGCDKATLPTGNGEVMLQRVVRQLSAIAPVQHLVVVAGAEQSLPQLPPQTPIIRDAQPGQGPLPAVLAGLHALPVDVDAAFATGCDAPFLEAAVIERLFQLQRTSASDVAIPAELDRLHPLAAVYSKRAVAGLQPALDEGRRSLHSALQSSLLRVRRVSRAELQEVGDVDAFLTNCNTAEEFAAALAKMRK